jgi:hypothetical protein
MQVGFSDLSIFFSAYFSIKRHSNVNHDFRNTLLVSEKVLGTRVQNEDISSCKIDALYTAPLLSNAN